MMARATTADTAPASRSRRSGRLLAVIVLAAGACAGFALAILYPALWENHGRTAGLAAGAVACCLLAAAIAVMAKARAPDASPAHVPAEPVDLSDPCEQIPNFSGPVLDEDALAALLRLGDEAFVAEVTGQFAAEGTLLLLKLARAVSEADAAAFSAHTHALRSGAANVGARRLYRLCLHWREVPSDELATSGSAKFVLLQKEFEAAQRALRAWQERRGISVTQTARVG